VRPRSADVVIDTEVIEVADLETAEILGSAEAEKFESAGMDLSHIGTYQFQYGTGRQGCGAGAGAGPFLVIWSRSREFATAPVPDLA